MIHLLLQCSKILLINVDYGGTPLHFSKINCFTFGTKSTKVFVPKLKQKELNGILFLLI